MEEKELPKENFNEPEVTIEEPKTCTTATDCGTAPMGFYYKCEGGKYIVKLLNNAN